MKRVPRISVVQGSIHVTSVKVAISTEDVIMLVVDTRAKYAEIDGLGGSGVHLGVGERTLNYEVALADRSTSIDVLGLGPEWVPVASAGRYTVRIVYVRELRRRRNTLRIRGWSDVTPGQ